VCSTLKFEYGSQTVHGVPSCREEQAEFAAQHGIRYGSLPVSVPSGSVAESGSDTDSIGVRGSGSGSRGKKIRKNKKLKKTVVTFMNLLQYFKFSKPS